MKIFFSLIFILMIKRSITECTPGCLMCKESNCLTCDNINGYHLNLNYDCERRIEQNCAEFYPFSLQCKKCHEYYHTTPSGCKKVELPLDNCKNYITENNCLNCKSEFYLKNGICYKIKNPIENCLFHDENNLNKCKICKKNYFLTSSKEKCLITLFSDNCAFYSFLNCEDCDSNTIQEENFYIYNIKKEIRQNNSSSINNLIKIYSENKQDLNIFQKCGLKNIRNCKKFDNLEKCSVCEDGYFLKTEGNCSKFPKDPIYNCQIYKTPSICSRCESDYFLEHPRKCTLITPIEGCHFYDNSTNKIICEKCDPSKYLKNNKCIERKKTNIHGCLIYSNFSERCQKCEKNHILSIDTSECIAKIPGCKRNQIIEKDHVHINTHDFYALECKKCDDKLYLKSFNKCVHGSIINCLVYETGANVCQKCIEGYYLDSKKLCRIRENFIQFCDIYHDNFSSSCYKCNSSSIKFNLKGGCRKGKELKNCFEYENYDFCGKCEKNYQLNQNGSCDLIPEIENCEEKDKDLCIQCKENFLLKNGKCEEFDSMLNINCKDNNLNGLNSEFKCNSCNQFTVPFNFNKNFICKKITEHHDIKYCLKYKILNSQKTCEMCDLNLILSSNKKKCLKKCNYDETIIISEINFTNEINISNYKICKKIDLYGCEEASNQINNPKKYICGKCKKGYYPIESCSSELSYYNFSIKTPECLGNAFSGFECNLILEEDIFFPNASEPDSNCEFYTSDNNNKNFCQKCIWGKTGQIINFENTTFLDCSKEIQNCDKEVIFGGSAWNNEWIKDMYGFTIPSKFTCHRCSNNKIPFLFMSRKTKFIRFKNDVEKIIPNSGEDHFLNSDHLACLETSQKGLFMKDEEFVSFPENCALGYYSVDMKKKSEVGNIFSSAVCLACKNGFVPVFSQDGFFIDKCEEIKNCDLSSDIDGFFNACKKCKDNFVFFYDKNKNLVDFTKCIYNPSANCLSSIFGTENNSRCNLCKKGFSLNFDNVCEKIIPHDCINYLEKITYLLNEELTPIKLSILFYYNGKGFGCDFCNGSSISIFKNEENILCLKDKYVQQNIFLESTNYIINCKNYTLEKGELICKGCETNYIFNQSGKKCIKKLENCLIINNNEIECSICNPNYTLVKKICVHNTIDFCTKYINGINLLICKECQDNYYLKNNKCEIGMIKNCEIYNNEDNCKKCLINYFLISTQKKNFCSKIPLKQNCKEFTKLGNNLFCTQCVENFFKIKKENYFDKSICLPINFIENCEIYDIKEDFVFSNLDCLKCKENFYLKDEKCLLRTNLGNNCEELKKNEDECKTCKSNYLLEEGFCEKIIPGRENCEIYLNYENCELCKTGYYIKDNICHKIFSEIPNCKYYSDKDICHKCFDEYFLQQNTNTCEKLIIKNCEIVIAPNICEKCEKNYFLTRIYIVGKYTYKTDCEPGIIENCSEIENQEPLTCKTCKTHYYLNKEKLCQKTSSLISNCKIYYSNNICQQCIQGAILSSDKKSCLINNKDSLIYSNCKNLKYLETPRCTGCKEGFFFKNGKCVSCDSSIILGCRFCDPYLPDKCLVCKNGYNHTNDGMCKLNQALGAKEDFQLDKEEFYGIRNIIFVLLFIIYK